MPIFKSLLPSTKLLGMLEDAKVQYSGSGYEVSTLLHFTDRIMAFSMKNPKNVATLFAQRDSEEVFHIPDIGLLTYKKDTKDIKLFASPLDFKRADKQDVIYSSNNFIKRVVIDKSDKKKPIFYIADEAKYLKKGILDKKEDDLCKFIC